MNLTEHESRVLEALRNAGTAGLNSYSAFRKDNALQISGTVRNLKLKGYMIKTKRHQDRSVTYFLLHEPANAPKTTAKPAETRGHWEWTFEGDTARKVFVSDEPEQGRLFS